MWQLEDDGFSLDATEEVERKVELLSNTEDGPGESLSESVSTPSMAGALPSWDLLDAAMVVPNWAIARFGLLGGS